MYKSLEERKMTLLKIGVCSLLNFVAGGLVYNSTKDVSLATATLIGLQSILAAIVGKRN